MPVPVLLNTGIPADTTYLDGVRDQQALLTKLRAAAATRGPLLVYLSGRLTIDRRARQLYLALALAHTTPSTVRYTALPWEWLGTELRHRPAGLTTVIVDLAADKHAWPQLQESSALATPPTAEVYGVIAPPGYAGNTGVSPYTRGIIEQLRRNHPDRPANSRLHALAAGSVALPPGALVLPHTRELPAPQSDSWPSAESNVQRLLAGDPAPLGHLRERSRQQQARPREVISPPPAPPQAQPAGPVLPSPRPAYDDVDHHRQRAAPAAHPVRAPHPGHETPATAAPPQPIAAQQPAPPHTAPSMPPGDPRPYIRSMAEQGRFTEAMQLAQIWEQHTLDNYGIDSAQATQWTEIRADLAKMQRNWVLATQLWIAAGRTRLAHQAIDAPEILAAAKSAHYCWTQIQDPRRAIDCGPDLIALLRALPALDRRHVSTAQQRLEYLHALPSGR
ncbi:hypothetical protein ABZ532_29435 [Streptomyces sp. NPDC019396]|uniref:hypothetical protein n=1 Tax=Streptomyces sp. NPDC019396 TaxID=3154687 RepID=UPI0033FD1AFB